MTKKTRLNVDAWFKEHQRKLKSDPDYKAEVEKRAEESRKNLLEMSAKVKSEEELFEQLAPYIAQHFGPGNGAYYISRMIELFDCDEYSVTDLSLQWTIESYVYRKIAKVLPTIDKIYSGLKKLGHDAKKMLSFNDMDDHLWYIPHPKDRVFAYVTDSPLQLLFIAETLEGYKNHVIAYHCRQYWDSYKPSSSIPDVSTVENAIRRADTLTQYSDNIAGNPYVNRPDIKWFKDQKFQVKYGDFRDPGYVFTIRAPDKNQEYAEIGKYQQQRVEGSLTHLGIMNRALFSLSTSIVAVEEELREKSKKRGKAKRN